MDFLRICGSYHVRTSCGQFKGASWAVKFKVVLQLLFLASYMFDEMFRTVSAVKGEYRDFVMFNMQLGLGIARCSEEMSGMISTCTYAQLINRESTSQVTYRTKLEKEFKLCLGSPQISLLLDIIASSNDTRRRGLSVMCVPGFN
ncbi:hypothetical protein KY284_027042 [Solanum tuberosum]|nr:hypothetical protein KY284_027042 [Solanum tuberosum]